MWRNRNPHTLLECRIVQPLWKTVWQFLQRLNIELPYDSAIPPHLTEIEICPHKNLYTNVHSSIIHNSQKVKTTQMSIN